MRRIISNGPNTVMEGIFTAPVVETRIKTVKQLERERETDRNRDIQRPVRKKKRP